MTSQPHDLHAGQIIIDGKLHGWTGRPGPNCQGSGEGRGFNGEWKNCTACAGTGDEHGLLDNQPADMSVYYKTADQWLNTDPYKGITILDPDGWDRKNLDASWAKPITQDEFDFRLSISTASYPKDLQMEKTSTAHKQRTPTLGRSLSCKSSKTHLLWADANDATRNESKEAKQCTKHGGCGHRTGFREGLGSFTDFLKSLARIERLLLGAPGALSRPRLR